MFFSSLLILQLALGGVASGGNSAMASGVAPDVAPDDGELRDGAVATAALWGADVRALAIHPGDPEVLAAGTSAGHIYLSRDGGRSWKNAGDPLPFPGWVVGTLRFDPHRPDRLWAALWGVWGSGLVAVSDDLGGTWRERMGPPGEGLVGALPREPVYDLVVETEAPDVLYAGARSGVWFSHDAGRRWIHLTAAYPEIHHVSSLLVHPERPRTLVAGTWRLAYRSDDGGLTWRGAFDGMELDSEVFQLRSVPGRAEELWASTCGWVYLSPDLGESWTRFKEGLPERRTPAFAVLEDGRLLAGTIAGLYLSEDHGRTWRRRTDPALGIRVIAHDPRRPERIVLGTEGAGVWISTDAGSRFEPSSRGMTNVRVGAVAVSGDEVRVTVRDAGPFSGVHRSTDGGRSFRLESGRTPTAVVRERAELSSPDLWREARRWAAREQLGEVLRVLGTGDAGGPYLVVGESAARLFDPSTEAPVRVSGSGLPLFFPARDIVAAALQDDRLYLGTTAHGLVIVELPAGWSDPGAGSKATR